jgi:hypothetical protein
MKNLNTGVMATFGGQAVAMELQRDELPLLEASLDGSAYACLNRFIGGIWTVRELQLVLSAAMPIAAGGFEENSPAAHKRKMIKSMAEHGFATGVIDSPVVLQVLRERPPARYAVLAVKLLEASLFGLPENQASFDEDVEEAA